MLILLMLGISEERYGEILYELQEKYHDLNQIPGSYYVHEPFRNWWMLCAERHNEQFLNAMTINDACEYRIHMRDNEGDHFIYGRNNIKAWYMKYMKRMISLPANVAVMELCKGKVKTIRR